MKKIILLLLTLSTASFAKNRIGEWAAYDYTEKTATRELKAHIIREVVDSENKKAPTGEVETYLKISEKKITNGKALEEKVFWDIDTSYLTKFELNLFVQLCRFKSSMGTYEKLTIQAGTFNACKVKDQENWLAPVAFGTLLYIVNDGTTFKRYELIDYGWKKKN